MGNSKTVLAIDSGGFKTDIVVVKYVDDEIEKQGRFRLGPLNIAFSDASIWQPKLSECFEGAFSSFGEKAKIDVALFSINGVGDENFRNEIEEWTRQNLDVDDVIIMSDVELILAISEAMVDEEEAILAVNAGVGSIALGIDIESETVFRAGGWGHLIGDVGSGYWMGREAIRRVLEADELPESESKLKSLIFAHTGVESPHDLIGHFSSSCDARLAISDIASVVVEAMRAGDGDATQIFQQAATELNNLVKDVFSQLDVRSYVLFLSGYLLCEVEEFTTAFAEQFSFWDVGPSDIYYIDDPVMLAAALAARIE